MAILACAIAVARLPSQEAPRFERWEQVLAALTARHEKLRSLRVEGMTCWRRYDDGTCYSVDTVELAFWDSAERWLRRSGDPRKLTELAESLTGDDGRDAYRFLQGSTRPTVCIQADGRTMVLGPVPESSVIVRDARRKHAKVPPLWDGIVTAGVDRSWRYGAVEDCGLATGFEWMPRALSGLRPVRQGRVDALLRHVVLQGSDLGDAIRIVFRARDGEVTAIERWRLGEAVALPDVESAPLTGAAPGLWRRSRITRWTERDGVSLPSRSVAEWWVGGRGGRTESWLWYEPSKDGEGTPSVSALPKYIESAGGCAVVEDQATGRVEAYGDWSAYAEFVADKRTGPRIARKGREGAPGRR